MFSSKESQSIWPKITPLLRFTDFAKKDPVDTFLAVIELLRTPDPNNGSVTRLRKLVPEALATVDKELISKFCDTVREYEQAYSDGHDALSIESAV